MTPWLRGCCVSSNCKQIVKSNIFSDNKLGTWCCLHTYTQSIHGTEHVMCEYCRCCFASCLVLSNSCLMFFSRCSHFIHNIQIEAIWFFKNFLWVNFYNQSEDTWVLGHEVSKVTQSGPQKDSTHVVAASGWRISLTVCRLIIFSLQFHALFATPLTDLLQENVLCTDHKREALAGK